MSELYIEFCFLSLLGLSFAGGSGLGGDDGTASALSALSAPGVTAGTSAGC